MITNDQELAATEASIAWMHAQISNLRKVETNPQNYRASAGGFIAELDRLNVEVREYLSLHPSEIDQRVA